MVGFEAHSKTAWARPAHILSNFSIQYSFGTAAVVMVIMSTTYCTATPAECMKGIQAHGVVGTNNAVCLFGAIIGQLCMGAIADVFGRNNTFLGTLTLATIGNIFSAILPSGSAMSVYTIMIICRFFVGVGLGGVYPLSATKAAEDDGSEDGTMVDPRQGARAFFWQMPGIMGPYLMAMMILSGSDQMTVDGKFRLLNGFGAVFTGGAAFCIYMENREIAIEKGLLLTEDRLKNIQKGAMSAALNANKSRASGVGGLEAGEYNVGALDSPGSTTDEDGGDKQQIDANKSVKSIASVSSLTDSFAYEGKHMSFNHREGRPSEFGWTGTPSSSCKSSTFLETLQSEYRTDKQLVAKIMSSGMTWFCFDVVVYGIGLFLPEILESIVGHTDDVSSPASVLKTAKKALIVQCLGIPATGLIILLLPYTNLRSLQVYGFILLGIACMVFMLCFSLLDGKSPNILFACFCFLGFCMQCGVNVTTYTLPAALFRKDVRATMNGVAAAMGKVGAVIGAYLFPVIRANVTNWFTVVLIICAMICFIGAWLTF